MQETKDYVYFYTSVDMFSNFYASKFRYFNHLFFCSEQAFMWRKAVFFGDEEVARKILAVKFNPNACKQLGRQVKNYNDTEWKKVRYEVMVDVLKAKFEEPALKKALLATGTKKIAEASVSDTDWGIGLNEDTAVKTIERKWKGLNLLGKALMEVRESLT